MNAPGSTTRILPWILAADVAVEVAIGAALLAARGSASAWFGLGEPTVVALGAVFLLAGAAVSAIAGRGARRGAVLPLALGNVAGGVVGWLVAIVAWRELAPEGRWLLAAAADTFIVLGALELLALRADRAFDDAAE